MAMTISVPQRHKRRNKVGDGFKATIVGLSLMSLLVAWDLVARRDAAKALADTSPSAASPTHTGLAFSWTGHNWSPIVA